MSAADIRREEKQAQKAQRRFARLGRQQEKDFARYDRWVKKQLNIKKGGNMTQEQYDLYYVHPDPYTNKHFPWRWAFDESGVYVPPSPGSPGLVGSSSSMSTESVGDDVVEALNEGRVTRLRRCMCPTYVLFMNLTHAQTYTHKHSGIKFYS